MKGMILELGSGIWESLLTEGSKHGGVAFGFIIASAINYFFTRLAGKSCRAELAQSLERQKYLDQQMQIKDARIERLHQMIYEKENL